MTINPKKKPYCMRKACVMRIIVCYVFVYFGTTIFFFLKFKINDSKFSFSWRDYHDIKPHHKFTIDITQIIYKYNLHEYFSNNW